VLLHPKKKKEKGSKISTDKYYVNAVLSMAPTFEMPTDVYETNIKKMTTFSRQQVVGWVQSGGFQHILPAFLPKKWMQEQAMKSEDTDNKEEMPTFDEYIDKDKVTVFSNSTDVPNDFFIKITASNLEEAHRYLVIGKDHKLRTFWDYYAFKKTFLICFNLFEEPEQLIDRLIELYKTVPKDIPEMNLDDPEDVENYRSAPVVLDILQDWMVMEYGADFIDNHPLNEKFQDFISNVVINDYPDRAKNLLETHQTIITLRPPFPFPTIIEAPEPIAPNKEKTRNSSY